MIEIIIGFVIGWILSFVHFANKLNKVSVEDFKKFKSAGNKEEEKQVPVLNIEKHGNMFYLFNHETNTFICQGSSIDELAEKAYKYQNIQVAIIQNNKGFVKIINGKIA